MNGSEALDWDMNREYDDQWDDLLLLEAESNYWPQPTTDDETTTQTNGETMTDEENRKDDQ